MSLCSKCGSRNQLSGTSGICSICGSPFAGASSHIVPHVSTADSIAWEHFEHLGIFTAAGQTIAAMFKTPGQFFKQLSTVEKSYKALLFAIIVGSLGSVCMAIWNVVLQDSIKNLLPDNSPYLSMLFQNSRKDAALMLAFSPLFAMLQVLFTTLYVSFIMTISHTKHRSFGHTFRMICYLQCTSLFLCVPVIGIIIAVLVQFPIFIVGMTVMHGMSKFRAITLVVVPPFILLLIVGALCVATISLGVVTSELLKGFF